MSDVPPELDLRSAAKLLTAYRDGSTDPLTAVAESLRRIQAADEALNCTISVLADQAMARAKESTHRWQTGTPRQLEGVPFGIKDVFDLTDTVTTSGSLVHCNRIAGATAVTVKRLLAAGAIPVSKDATTEWAVGGPHNPLSGPTRNPWDRTRWSGGSSAGSAAAVSAGAFPFALGSDAGGSIRIPSAYCGVTGVKTTSGLVPRIGATPLSWTTETVGPIAGSAEDAAMMLETIAGEHPLDPQTLPSTFQAPHPAERLDGLRVGVPGGYFSEDCDAAVIAGFESFIALATSLGATCAEVSIPSAAEAHQIGYHVLFTEAWTLHEANAASFGDYDPVALRRIGRGSATSARDYLLMLAFRARLQRELEAVFDQVDVVAMPGTPAAPPDLVSLYVSINGTQVPMYQAQSRATMLCNLSGVPAIMMPSGFTAAGLPVAVQLIGRPLGETRLLSTAIAHQQASGLMHLDALTARADHGQHDGTRRAP